ncbi:phosphotyrosine picked threonine kinase [Coccidioides immitis H538.4]|uniref:Phosphotyrosine picked threonine kinase n=1 Tax=Coccidioides immitis H538.4 TaxID=396776 RepID=A0A0J8S5K9_COCIT|nr:phosphotyrosine picked threonine kinase [Coccidioides immitis H538.4]
MSKYSDHEVEYSDGDLPLSPPSLSTAARNSFKECSKRPPPPPMRRSNSKSRLPNIQGAPRVSAAPRIVKLNGPLLKAHPQRFMTPSCGGFSAGEEVSKQSELRPYAEYCVKPSNSPPNHDIHLLNSYSKPILQRTASTPKMAACGETVPDAENKIKKKKQHRSLLINKITYTRLDCIGRGGSSRVFRVLTAGGDVLALKRVSLKDMDPSIIQGYKGEIDLLRRLAKLDRAVNLVDWELDCQESTLSLVMEFGDIDFESLLRQQIGSTDAILDTTFIRHYWKEMAHCVEAVHRLNIVHSDLKPANFVFFVADLNSSILASQDLSKTIP